MILPPTVWFTLAGRLEAYCPDTFKGASITIHTLQRDTGCFLMTLGSTYMNDERGITSNRKSQAAKASEMDAFKKLKKGEYCKTREDAYTKLRESADHQMTEFNAQKSKVATPATAEVK
jgi:hypothetical protein